ncbi:futalosine hydrolase [Geomonas sp. Red32]|uniref:futalosine hydrolase n=1 Tax=Geomonas sp. Red32 TaxID=2912856 RepID=UPI00202CC2EF|nr:futalosine hydrolase [Geomonas sp. Red32]MCM0080133.1 futalosine hydrolase [Geomonas sp. Red32]
MPPIAILASTIMELSQLVKAASAVPVELGHLEAYRGSVAGREVLCAVTGIGKANAASATTVLLERKEIELLVNIGCGGAFPGQGLSVGGLAIATSECFADEGVLTPQGWHGLDLIGIPLFEHGGRPVFNAVELPGELASFSLQLARRLGVSAQQGPFLTVSTCSGTSARAAELLAHFPALCENMEGAAVAQMALLYGVPFLEVRGISNLVEDRDLSRWDLKGAVTAAQSFVLELLQSPLPLPHR